MNGLFSRAFKGQRSVLAQKINVTGLWPQLSDDNILTDWQIQDCRGEKTPMDQVTKLMEHLEKRDDASFIPFCRILVANNQEQVANSLLEKVGMSLSTDQAAKSQPANPPAPLLHAGANIEEHRYPEDSFDVSLQNFVSTSDAELKKCKEQAFPMTSNPRGTVLIFNIFKTFGMGDREGTKADCDNLVKLFKKLLFNVKVYSDVSSDPSKTVPDKLKPTADNILKYMKTTLDGLSAEEQCFILVTLSHGGINESDEEVIYGCDGKGITKKAILEVIADGESFPDKDMPRLVFFQCCRGEKEMFREQKDCTDVFPNTLYCHSCTRDYVSYRNPVLGTRFVRALVDTFAKNAHDTDIVGLMDKVKEAMRKIDPSKWYDQVPQHIFDPVFAQKKLFFFPGISE